MRDDVHAEVGHVAALEGVRGLARVPAWDARVRTSACCSRTGGSR